MRHRNYEIRTYVPLVRGMDPDPDPDPDLDPSNIEKIVRKTLISPVL